MATTYPLPTLAPTIDATGISAPSYNDVYQSLLATFKGIYGSDIYVAPDSQDGQWIAALAQAISDANSMAVTLFQSFSPLYAQGAALSSRVKLNGLTRNVPTNSTAVGNVVGQAGKTITNGVVKDISGNLWNLPATVNIPTGGSVAVTVTAQAAGSINAPAGTIDTIATPQLGWQSFVSTTDAVPGNPVESDPALRARQASSTALPAQTVLDAIVAAVGNVTGVTRVAPYENDTDVTDANGVPAHSFAIVVEGGNIASIAAAINSKKPPGIQTYGTTTQIVYDANGLPTTINFFVLQLVNVLYDLTIQPLNGYTSTTGAAIISSLAEFTNSLAIGEDVYPSQAQAAASLAASGLGGTFYITSFSLGASGGSMGSGAVSIPFSGAAACASGNVNLTVL